MPRCIRAHQLPPRRFWISFGTIAITTTSSTSPLYHLERLTRLRAAEVCREMRKVAVIFRQTGYLSKSQEFLTSMTNMSSMNPTRFLTQVR